MKIPLRVRVWLCHLLGCAEVLNDDDRLAQVHTAPNPRLSNAELTQLLESSRSEIRSYHTLYGSLLTFGVLSITVITWLPFWEHSSVHFKELVTGIWFVGVILLLWGLFSIFPRFNPRSTRANDLKVLKGIEGALLEEDDEKAHQSLAGSVQFTLRIQRRIADAKSIFLLGSLLILGALLLMGIASGFAPPPDASSQSHQPTTNVNTSSGDTNKK